MVFLLGQRNRSNGGDFKISISPSLCLAHWFQNPHSCGSPAVGWRPSTWQRWWFSEAVLQLFMSQEECCAAPRTCPQSPLAPGKSRARPSVEQLTLTWQLVSHLLLPATRPALAIEWPSLNSAQTSNIRWSVQWPFATDTGQSPCEQR